VCAAGVALLLMAKNGLSDVAGWSSLGFFVASVAVARTCAVPRAA
jgi:hypothetical protein